MASPGLMGISPFWMGEFEGFVLYSMENVTVKHRKSWMNNKLNFFMVLQLLDLVSMRRMHFEAAI